MNKYIFFACIILLTGCSSNSLVSSFSSRKYTKGIFRDVPAETYAVVANFQNSNSAVIPDKIKKTAESINATKVKTIDNTPNKLLKVLHKGRITPIKASVVEATNTVNKFANKLPGDGADPSNTTTRKSGMAYVALAFGISSVISFFLTLWVVFYVAPAVGLFAILFLLAFEFGVYVDGAICIVLSIIVLATNKPHKIAAWVGIGLSIIAIILMASISASI